MNKEQSAEQWKPTHHIKLKVIEVKPKTRSRESSRDHLYTFEDDVREIAGPPHSSKDRPKGNFYQTKAEFDAGKMPDVVGYGWHEEHMRGSNFIQWEIYSLRYEKNKIEIFCEEFTPITG